MHLADRGHDVVILDNLVRREWDVELGSGSLTPIASIEERLKAWHGAGGREIKLALADLLDWEALAAVVDTNRPEAIVHYAEQSSAPYSMIDREHTVSTQYNNVIGKIGRAHV